MNSTDLVVMLGNLSRSMFSLQQLLSGLAYVLGLIFFYMAITKLKKMAASGSHSQEKIFVPMAYLLGAAALVFLPSSVHTLANTAFGTGNILAYASYSPYNIKASMTLIIQTAGVIWFIRGCVLLMSASQPGVKHGPKGLAFLFAGILSINFQSTISMLTGFMEQLSALTMTIKSSQGY